MFDRFFRKGTGALVLSRAILRALLRATNVTDSAISGITIFRDLSNLQAHFMSIFEELKDDLIMVVWQKKFKFLKYKVS